jgi:MoaA/NifB/PqqE/SkfB family radical SAM enzyme
VELAKCLGVRRVNVLRFVPQGRGEAHRNELLLSAEAEQSFLDDLRQLRSSCSVAIRTGSPFNHLLPGGRTPCEAGRGKLVIQPDGNVLPCEAFKHATRRNTGLSALRSPPADILGPSSLRALRSQFRLSSRFVCPVHSRSSEPVR